MLFSYKNNISYVKNKNIFIYDKPILGKTGLVNEDFEKVIFLLFYKKLPSDAEYKEFCEKIKLVYSKDFSNLINFLDNNKNNFKDINLLVSSILFSNKVENDLDIVVKMLVSTCNFLNIQLNASTLLPRKDLSFVENVLYINHLDFKNKKLTKHISKLLIAWIVFPVSPSVVATRISSNIKVSKLLSIVSGIIVGSGKKHIAARTKCSSSLIDLLNILESNGMEIKQNDKNIENKINTYLQNTIDNDSIIHGFGHYIFKGENLKNMDPRIELVKSAITDMFPNSKLQIIVDYMIKIVNSGVLKKNNKSLKLIPNSDIFWSVFLIELFDTKSPAFLENIYMYNILTRSIGLISNYNDESTNTSGLSINCID